MDATKVLKAFEPSPTDSPAEIETKQAVKSLVSSLKYFYSAGVRVTVKPVAGKDNCDTFNLSFETSATRAIWEAV